MKLCVSVCNTKKVVQIDTFFAVYSEEYKRYADRRTIYKEGNLKR